MVAKDATTEGKGLAIPSRMDLAKRMEDQWPAYTAMVSGLVGAFAKLDNNFAALTKQHDAEKAHRG